MEYSLSRFLLATRFIERDHPKITEKAIQLTAEVKTVEAMAERIFYFIRDEIRYEFIPKFTEQAYFASHILEAGRGFCTQKAILFCALARSLNIPAGIYFYDIVDHSLPAHTVDYLGTRTMVHHGIAALLLNGNWYQYDATLDIRLVNRNGLLPVEFHPDRHCLMSAVTKNGGRHIEYQTTHGLVDDVTFPQIMDWFKRGYPHLIGQYANDK